MTKSAKAIISLKGGLGNQMFQYAFGEMLKKEHEYEVYFDDSFFRGTFGKNVTPRKLELIQFPEIEIIRYEKKFYKSANFWKRLGRKVKGIETFDVIDEANLELDPVKDKLQKNVYFDGYWQSYRYVRRVLDSCLQIKFNPSPILSSSAHTAYSREITSDTNTVSVHIRRGDYLSNAKARELHPVCTIDYYNQAIEYMKTKLKTPRFFVFSDDIPWTKSHLLSPNTVYVDKTNSSLEDMALMAQCQHSIIANSSFSWWGAVLKKNHEQDIVIRPRKWFNGMPTDPGMFPDHWLDF